MRAILLALALLAQPMTASAEWQLHPFLGMTLGGGTTFVDLEHAAGHAHKAAGVSVVLLGDVIGIEADLGHVPGFFQTGDQRLLQTEDQRLLVGSRVSTLTGNVVIAAPRRLTQYTLRPYGVIGLGRMFVRSDQILPALSFAENLPAMDVGGGITGFLTEHVGLTWGVRYFRSVGQKGDASVDVADQQLSFWRLNMGVAIRY
jgi:hypothetical protein